MPPPQPQTIGKMKHAGSNTQGVGNFLQTTHCAKRFHILKKRWNRLGRCRLEYWSLLAFGSVPAPLKEKGAVLNCGAASTQVARRAEAAAQRAHLAGHRPQRAVEGVSGAAPEIRAGGAEAAAASQGQPGISVTAWEAMLQRNRRNI